MPVACPRYMFRPGGFVPPLATDLSVYFGYLSLRLFSSLGYPLHSNTCAFELDACSCILNMALQDVFSVGCICICSSFFYR